MDAAPERSTRPSDSAVSRRSVEWTVRVGMLVASVLAAYFTSQKTSEVKVATVETTERLHYEATQTSLREIKDSLQRQEDRWYRVLDDASRGVDRRTGEPVLLQRGIEEPHR